MSTTKAVKSLQNDKSSRILDAAYELFLEQGDENISISEITQRAGVAKGTFYSYFKDKKSLKDQLIAQKSSEIFRRSVQALHASDIASFDDQVIFVINYIINELTENRMALRLISKNLSFGMFNRKLQDYVGNENSDLIRALLLAARKNGLKLRNPRILLFMIIELTSSTCFSCILESRPMNINEFKPHLFAAIRQLIAGATE